jgi:hypothetical protein
MRELVVVERAFNQREGEFIQSLLEVEGIPSTMRWSAARTCPTLSPSSRRPSQP